MNESMRVGLYSLRFKFALACIVVEMIVLTAMVWNSNRIAENSLHEIFQARVQSLVPFMNVSLTNPLLQRDYATLDERLGHIVQPNSLVYIEVSDELDQPVARHGNVPQTSRLDTSFDSADGIYDQTFDITLAGRVIGHARYGLNISILKATQSKQRIQAIALALGAMALTFLLLVVLAHVLTRRLRELAQLAQAIQAGDYSVRVAEGGRDEVAVAAHTFNAMAHALEQDMAERKLAEQALREKEYLLSESQRVAEVGSWVIESPGFKMTLSDETYRLYGVSPDSFSPSSEALLSLTHPDDQLAVQEWLRACRAGEQPGNLIYRIIHPDGSIRTISGHGELNRDNANRPLMLGTVQDVTEREKTEQALRESETHFRTIFEQAADGIFISDAQGNILDVNTAGCQQVAYSRDELLKLNITNILAVEEVPRFASEIARLNRSQIVQSEWLFRRKDGSVFYGELAGKLLPDGRLQAFLHDITARKQAEATMQADSRQLQALSKRVLEAQEAERRHIARELHDELGQILTAIKINLQARNRLNGQSPVEIDSANIGMVEEAISQVRRLALALRPSMLDDLGLMAALRWAAEQTLGRAGVTVQWQGDIADQRLASEVETACYRIAQEAFTNIARHAQAKSVVMTLRHEGSTLLLMVQDDGHGFDVAEKRARATSGGSVGVLGMQERATLSGGQLEIESVPGQGTIIRARFPWRPRR